MYDLHWRLKPRVRLVLVFKYCRAKPFVKYEICLRSREATARYQKVVALELRDHH